MNFNEYRAFKETLELDNLVRMDCLNPFKAMDFLIADLEVEDVPISQDEVVHAWLDATQFSIPCSIACTEGVRDSLGQLLNKHSGLDIYLPNDIYPRYQEIAEAESISFNGYSALNGYEILRTGNRGLILLNSPVTPTGVRMTLEERQWALDFLNKDSTNVLVFDSVYAYDIQSEINFLTPLLDTGRCYVLHSLSKSFLAPLTLGLIFSKNRLYLEMPSIDKKELPRALSILHQFPNLPQQQTAIFEAEFTRLGALTGLDLSGEQAYFRVLPYSFEALLKKGILGVPLSVFGSPETQRCVVSCLYYAKHQNKV